MYLYISYTALGGGGENRFFFRVWKTPVWKSTRDNCHGQMREVTQISMSTVDLFRYLV
jgi:hypothetical protein